jgi:hypothetical protein
VPARCPRPRTRTAVLRGRQTRVLVETRHGTWLEEAGAHGNKIVLAGVVGVLLIAGTASGQDPGTTGTAPSNPYPPTPRAPPAYAPHAGAPPTPPPSEGVFAHASTVFTGYSLALSSGFTRVGERNGQTFGGRGVLMLGGTFGIGLAGHVIGTSDMDLDEEDVREAGLYGGLYLQGVLGSTDLIHTFVDVTLGGGGWCERSFAGECDDYEFSLVEPTLNVEVNLIANLRVALGVGYRQVIEDEGREPDGGLSGVVVRGSFVVGQF